MSTRWTEADVAKINARIRGAVSDPLKPTAHPYTFRPRNYKKYRNDKTEHNGQQFDSKKEFRDWQAFELQRLNGGIRGLVRQISLPLPGAKVRRIRIDFLVIENDGTHRWYDSKGFLTPAWATKRDLVRDAYGIEIQLV